MEDTETLQVENSETATENNTSLPTQAGGQEGVQGGADPSISTAFSGLVGKESQAERTGRADEGEGAKEVPEPTYKFKVNEEELELPHSEIQKRLAASQTFAEVSRAKKELEEMQAGLEDIVGQRTEAEREELLEALRENVPSLVQQEAERLIELNAMSEEERVQLEEREALHKLTSNLEHLQQENETSQEAYQKLMLETSVNSFLTQAQVSDPYIKKAFLENLAILYEDGNNVGPDGNVDYGELLNITEQQHEGYTGDLIKSVGAEKLVEILGEEGLRELANHIMAQKTQPQAASQGAMQGAMNVATSRVDDTEAGKGDIIL